MEYSSNEVLLFCLLPVERTAQEASRHHHLECELHLLSSFPSHNVLLPKDKAEKDILASGISAFYVPK